MIFPLAIAAELTANSLPIVLNVRMERDAPERLRVCFELVDEDDDDLTVFLRLFPDSSFIKEPSATIFGDMGSGISPGRGRSITIVGHLATHNFLPMLLAYDGFGFGGEMVEVVDSEDGHMRFYLDRYEVTNKEFEAFVEVGGYAMKEYWLIDDGSVSEPEIGWNYNNTYGWRCPKYWDLRKLPYWSNDAFSPRSHSPATGISWFEAHAYARWAGKRLPRLAEWKLAAGEERGFEFPWGDDPFRGQKPPVYTLCNWRLGFEGFSSGEYTHDGAPHAAPVGSYSPQGDSPYGVADMVGNVWEWCDDDVGNVDYGSFVCVHRALMGAGWKATFEYLSAGERRQDQCPLFRTNSTGFRCAR